MATIRSFELLDQGEERPTEPCVAKIVTLTIAGERFLQLNGYGHPSRGVEAGRTQNMRLSKAAFEQLIEVGTRHFGS